MPESPLLNLTHLAIEAALSANWEEALKINKDIIKLEPKNVDALTRKAKACLELGDPEGAEKAYNEALKIDSYNPIALKNLKMMKALGNEKLKQNTQNGKLHILSASMFLQEPGKTKIVSLLKVAEPQKLSQVYCGMSVNLVVKGKKVNVTDENDTYLGILPDDTAHLLARLISGGNKYECLVKSTKLNGLAILIRETFRSKKFKNQSSFIEGGSSSTLSNDILTRVDTDSENTDEETDQMEDADL